MHPLLGQLRRVLLYLVAWAPIAALLAYLLSMTHELRPVEAAALAIPLCLFYAFFCLSAWYPCRTTPVDRTSFEKLLMTHLGGALVAAGVWTFTAWLLAWILSSSVNAFRGLNERLYSELPVVLVTGILLYLLSVFFYYVLIALEASREAEARVMQMSILAREAELRALKAQVNPHFLFNSLNSISALTSSDPAKARDMCILLGDFLRRTLGLGEKSAIPLEEEMSLIHAFLAVEKTRYGARLQMEESIAKEALSVDVPPLLLQPLIENAISHGIANLVDGGWIHLNVGCENGSVSIVVENLFDPEAPMRRRNGVGLVNVRQRLQTRYGNRSTFAAGAEGDRFRVAMTLPAGKTSEKEVSAT
ncbi:MAG TPA: histidine kinase [Candidatus Acidoferrales bacterium]|jgi:sensor histidine kinase YesM|nr:histidine kinase [Candidatus Acidoferrales bacterium]